MVVRKQLKSRRKYGIAQKLLFKTKGPYRVLKKATPILYCLQCLTFCEDIWRPGRKVNQSAARMESIPSTMVLSNPRSLRQGDQIALTQLKSDIKISKYKLFFVKHMSVG